MQPLSSGLYPGDFITLDARSDAGHVAVVLGETRDGNLRVRRCRPFNRKRDHIRTYRGAWSLLPITDARHPLYELEEGAA